MSDESRRVDSLTLDDFKASRVWQFVPENEHRDETYVRAINRLPVTHLDDRLVSCELCLNDGTRLWGVLGNVQIDNERLTELFTTVSLFRPDGTQFYLARYFDIDYERSGPNALAKFLGVPKAGIFPMEWDVSDVVLARSGTLRGSIQSEPKERLTRSQIIALAVPRPRFEP